MTPTETIAQHPALAAVRIQDLEATVECLRAFIAGFFPDPIPPEQIRAALRPESEHSADAI